jgi:hypothetical protein
MWRAGSAATSPAPSFARVNADTECRHWQAGVRHQHPEIHRFRWGDGRRRRQIGLRRRDVGIDVADFAHRPPRGDRLLTDRGFLDTLLVVISLASAWTYAGATVSQGVTAIKKHAHGYRCKSWFRSGFRSRSYATPTDTTPGLSAADKKAAPKGGLSLLKRRSEWTGPSQPPVLGCTRGIDPTYSPFGE